MPIYIRGSELRGTIRVPPSKSYTHRALICAGLAEGKSEIVAPLICDDTLRTINGLRALGVKVSVNRHSIEVNGGKLSPKVSLIECGASGTTLRFLTGVCSTINSKVVLTGSGSLLRRPIGELVKALNRLCARVISAGDYPPVIVRGKLRGGIADIRGDISSQFISAVLIAAPLAEEGVEVIVTTKLESRPYVRMTIEVQNAYGVNVQVLERPRLRFSVSPSEYEAGVFHVEGDWSSAAYLLAGSAISGRVKVVGVNPQSIQADRRILDVIEQAGARIHQGPSWVEVEGEDLEGFRFDVSDSPDLFPTLAAMAAVADGASEIAGIERNAFKESNRIEMVLYNLRRLGVEAWLKDDRMIIKGRRFLKGGIVKTGGDHRIAMAFSLLGLRADKGIVIDDGTCIRKSYPNFWRDLSKLGVMVGRPT